MPFLTASYFFPGVVNQPLCNGYGLFLIRLVGYGGDNFYISMILSCLWRRNIRSVSSYMHRICSCKPNVPINTGSSIPAWTPSGSIDSNCYDVFFPCMEIRCKIIFYATKAIRSMTEVFSVYINIALLEDSIKENGNSSSFIGLRHEESFAIPPNTFGQICS